MPSPQFENSISCTRRIEFDAAHRVMLHESACKYLHGHRYAVEATFTGSALDNVGRVIDFGVVKEILGGWIMSCWDHAVILNVADEALGHAITSITGQRVFFLPTNPTAENMAQYLVHEVCPELFAEYPIRCSKIRLYETPNCYAEAVASPL